MAEMSQQEWFEWLATQPQDVQDYFASLNDDATDDDDDVLVQITPESIQKAKETYPDLAQYLDHPELGPILVTAAEKGWTPEKLQGAIRQTEWWASTLPSIREWDYLTATDPAAARERIQDKMDELSRAGWNYGFELDEAVLRGIAIEGLRQGWDDRTFNSSLLARARQSGIQVSPYGSLESTKMRVRELVNEYLIAVPPKMLDEIAWRVANGKMTLDGLDQWARHQAKGQWRGLSDHIDNGFTIQQYFSPVRQTVSQILGMNYEDIDLSSDRWSDLTQLVDDGSGGTRSMTSKEAANWARSQKEYRFTQEYQDRSSELAASIGEMFGFI